MTSVLAVQGQYNEDAWEAFDFVIDEAGKRGLRLVIALANNWDSADTSIEHRDWANTDNKWGPSSPTSNCSQPITSNPCSSCVSRNRPRLVCIAVTPRQARARMFVCVCARARLQKNVVAPMRVSNFSLSFPPYIKERGVLAGTCMPRRQGLGSTTPTTRASTQSPRTRSLPTPRLAKPTRTTSLASSTASTPSTARYFHFYKVPGNPKQLKYPKSTNFNLWSTK